MFEFSTDNISVAELEATEPPFDVNAGDGVATTTVAPKKRGRGRPKGSPNKTANGPAALPQAATPAPRSQHASRASATCGELVFDIETVPDYSRLELFGLEPLPEVKPERTRANCTPVCDLLDGSIGNIKQYLAEANPVHEYLDLLAEAERQNKNRDGVHKEIAAARAAKNAAGEAIEKRRKLLSVTPEYCRVAAIGWAVRGEAPDVMVADDPKDERRLLETFWALAKAHRPLIGYGILHFDLPVIFCRSAILGIPSSCMLDMKPWGGDVLDLMVVRFPKSGAMAMKDLARLYGIHVPAGDVDGSQVEELLRTDPEAVGTYCKSDVEVARGLHRMWCGYFCQ